MVAVEIRGLEKRFGETLVLRGVDLEIPDGAFAVLVGPSGCGKSTLLRLIAGLEEATAGSIRFGGREVTTLAPRERDIAMVFQSYALYPHLSVRDNLAFGLKMRGEAKATIARRVDEVAKMLGLGELLDRKPAALSGGQRQRVAMGRAIARRPALFLFDEPLSNLDAALRAQVRVDIRRQHDRLHATSVYVTHDQVEAMTLADVMFVLNRGRVEQRGTPAEVYRRPATQFVAGFLGSPAMNFLEGVLEPGDEGLVARAVTGDDGGSLQVPLPAEGLDAPLAAGGRVTIGVRPHDVRPAAQGEAPHLTCAASLVELLGPELQIHARVGEAPITLCTPADRAIARGERLRLCVDRVHLFDPSSGVSLW